VGSARAVRLRHRRQRQQGRARRIHSGELVRERVLVPRRSRTAADLIATAAELAEQRVRACRWGTASRGLVAGRVSRPHIWTPRDRLDAGAAKRPPSAVSAPCSTTPTPRDSRRLLRGGGRPSECAEAHPRTGIVRAVRGRPAVRNRVRPHWCAKDGERRASAGARQRGASLQPVGAAAQREPAAHRRAGVARIDHPWAAHLAVRRIVPAPARRASAVVAAALQNEAERGRGRAGAEVNPPGARVHLARGRSRPDSGGVDVRRG